METTTNYMRSESWSTFKKMVDWENQPSGFRLFKVKIIDGNDGSSSTEYATDDSEREDMTAVSDGYFFECSWCTKK
jgi:hypothetical protein